MKLSQLVLSIVCLFLLVATLVVVGRRGGLEPRTAVAAPRGAASQEVIDRGKYLVTVGGCNDCHTPFKMGKNGPEPDMSRALSGHPATVVLPEPNLHEPWIWAGAATNTAFAGPWGVTYAPNLTPDSETGFGIYTEEMFVQAMRTGKQMGAGRPIMPPMPWPNYGQMTDDDLKAIFAYLHSIPPVKNQVPQYRPPQVR